ncbi:MAG: YcxB family protein, partial [Verrucomicrobiaceae bacterium]
MASDILQVRIVAFLIIFGGGWLVMAGSSRLLDWLVMTVRPNHSGLNGILCEHTVTIDPEGLAEVTPVNESRHYWRGVHRVDSTSEHIFIYIQP